MGLTILYTLIFSLCCAGIAFASALSTAIFILNKPKNKNLATVKYLFLGLSRVPFVFFGCIGVLLLVTVTARMEGGEGFMILLLSFVLTVVGIYPMMTRRIISSLQEVPRDLVLAAQSLGASKIQTLLFINVPYAFKGLLSAAIKGFIFVYAELLVITMLTNSVNRPAITLGNEVATQLFIQQNFDLNNYVGFFFISIIVFVVGNELLRLKNWNVNFIHIRVSRMEKLIVQIGSLVTKTYIFVITGLFLILVIYKINIAIENAQSNTSDVAYELAIYPYTMIVSLLPSLELAFLTTILAVAAGVPIALFISEGKKSKVQNWLRGIVNVYSTLPAVYFSALTVFIFLIVGSDVPPYFIFAVGTAVYLLPVSIKIFIRTASKVPDSYRERALALGATRYYIAYNLILPTIVSTTLPAIVRLVSRSISETIPYLLLFCYLQSQHMEVGTIMGQPLAPITVQIFNASTALPFQNIAVELVINLLVVVTAMYFASFYLEKKAQKQRIIAHV